MSAVDVSDPGRGPMIVAVTSVFTAITALTVIAWLYVRKTQKMDRGWDDWLMSFAMILRIVCQVQNSYPLKYGMGKHDRYLTPEQLSMIEKHNWASIPTAVLTSVIARIAIAILLIRLFGVHRWFTIFLIVNTVLLVASAVAFILVTFLQAQPIEALWNPSILDARHLDPRVWLYLAYFFQSVCSWTDLTYVLFPVFFIARLNMAMARKLGIALLMSMSLLTMALSILKTIWVALLSSGNQSGIEFQYNASYFIIFGTLEQNFVIIMGCVPSLRGLAKLDFSRLRGWTSSFTSLLSGRRDSLVDSSSGASRDTGHADIEMGEQKISNSSSMHLATAH